MSTTASYNSWAPAKFKGGRNFLRENKMHLREVDKTVSGGGISSDAPMQPIHSQPPLWRPVQKIYPESRQMRLAQARAFGGRSDINGPEPAMRRCGLYETQQQEIDNPMWSAAGTARMQAGSSCASRMPAAGISYSRQREQEIQTDGINDKQFLTDSLKKCKTKATVSEGTNTGSDGAGDKPLSARSRASTRSKRSTVSGTASRRSSASNRSQASNKTLVGDDNVSVAGSVAASVTGSVAGSTHANVDDNLDKQSIHSSVISQHSSKSRMDAGHDQKRKHQQSHDRSVCCPHCRNKRVEDDGGSIKSRSSTRTSHQRERGSQRSQSHKQNTPEFTEEQRMRAIQEANFDIKALLEEYNRLPVSAQTFRVRNRKLEIEKSLDDLEHNIHRLSYPHLYLKSF